MTVACEMCAEQVQPGAPVCVHCGHRAARALALGPPASRSPVVAAVLAWVLPGLGHLYAGRPGRGVSILLLAAVLYPLVLTEELGGSLPLPGPLKLGLALLLLGLLLGQIVEAYRLVAAERRGT